MLAPLAAAVLSAATAFDAGEPLALEGFSGHLNVPSAYVHAPGALHLLVTNQEDPRSRGREYTHTWIASAGFLRWVEGGGRVTDVGGEGTGRLVRDLSLNAKLRLPLDLLWPDLPLAIAAGVQDEGGAAPHFRTRYVVVSGRLGWLTASVGHGTGPDRMEGTFAGATLAPLRYAELVADWDARELNGGVRLRLPLSVLGVPLELGGIAKSSVQNWPRVELAGTLAVPLAFTKWREAPPRDAGRAPFAPPAATPEAVPSAAPPLASAPPLPSSEPLPEVEAGLESLELSGVRAARDGTTCAVEYENERFRHAEADALGLALGTLAALAPPGCEEFLVVVDRQRLPFAAVSGPMDALRAWFDPDGPRGSLPDVLRLRWKPRRPPALAARQPRDPTAFHAALSLSPGLTSFVATEVSVLEVLVSLRPAATLQLWPGAQLAARADVPVYASSALDRGRPFRSYWHEPRLEDALLQQVVPLAPGVTALVAGGVYRAHSAGVLGELQLTPGGGAHALGVQASWTRVQDWLPAPTATDLVPRGPSVLGTWRYAAPWSVVALLRAGKFYSGDRGFSVDLSRFFGDTQLGVFYARTDASIVGGTLSFPLGPRRDLRAGPVLVGGASRFGHEISSVVSSDRNEVTTGLAVPPRSPWSLEETWLDHGRLHRRGLADALGRARAAFGRWGDARD